MRCEDRRQRAILLLPQTIDLHLLLSCVLLLWLFALCVRQTGGTSFKLYF